MKRVVKISMVLAICSIAMMSCSGRGNAQSKPRDGKPKTQEQIKAALTNFSISLVVETQEQDPLYHKHVANDKGMFFEIKCERMKSFDNDFNEIFVKYNEIDFVDFTAKKVYQLKPLTKTGMVSELDAAEAGKRKGLNRLMAHYLSMHESYINDLKKTGNEKIIGRDATVYADTAASSYDTSRKIWIDNEYGCTLKLEETHGDNKTIVSVTEFIVGGASVEGLVDLGEYKIEKKEIIKN
jgi:hypothetical protein